MSTVIRPAQLIEQMSAAAKARFLTDAKWANAAGLPKETLSRLKSQSSCDLRTLGALAKTVGCTLAPVPEGTEAGTHFPGKFNREYEERLLDLAASQDVDPAKWRALGPAFFMGGLAVMLASAREFSRERYLRLGEALHPGVSNPEVFAMWLNKSPVRASRFLPMVRNRLRVAWPDAA
jgi:hypothetical protein